MVPGRRGRRAVSPAVAVSEHARAATPSPQTAADSVVVPTQIRAATPNLAQVCMMLAVYWPPNMVQRCICAKCVWLALRPPLDTSG